MINLKKIEKIVLCGDEEPIIYLLDDENSIHNILKALVYMEG